MQCKVECGSYILANTSSSVANFGIGDYVVVEGDRGEDIGIIVDCHTRRYPASMRDESNFKKIYRFATMEERNALTQKEIDEQIAKKVNSYSKVII